MYRYFTHRNIDLKLLQPHLIQIYPFHMAAFPICILISPQVSESTKARLQNISNFVIRVESILCPYKNVMHEASWTNSELTKLHIWNLTQFRKIVYIDADALVLENIDELFNIESKFAASPDIFPPDKFNAGVMVIEPDALLFQEMMTLVGVLPSHDGGDTGFLNSYFSSWYSGPACSRLPFSYNAQRTLYWFTYTKQPGYWDSIKPLKIIHYSSSPKPWEMSPNSGNLGELEWVWWRTYMGV